MEAIIYNQDGKKSGTLTLPETMFNLPWNADLVHQVAMSMLSSRRKGTAHTKDRGEVAGSNKKPWQQKGTGRARHGSKRSPIWRHGGVTFGPSNEKNYYRKVNIKMRQKALYTVLSQKLRDNEILFLRDLSLKDAKTKEAKAIFNQFGSIKGFEEMPTKRKNSLMLALTKKDENVERSFRNFGNISLVEARSLNVADLLNYRFVAIVNPEEYVKNAK